MATSRKKLTKKQRSVAVLDVAFSLVAEMPPSCDALYAASEAIQQLIAENCPVAQPTMQQSKKRAMKK